MDVTWVDGRVASTGSTWAGATTAKWACVRLASMVVMWAAWTAEMARTMVALTADAWAGHLVVQKADLMAVS